MQTRRFLRLNCDTAAINNLSGKPTAITVPAGATISDLASGSGTANLLLSGVVDLSDDAISATTSTASSRAGTKAVDDFRAILDQLTTRELQVLRLMAKGLTTKQIAENLGITFKTAACHRGRVLSKLGASNAVQATRIAIRIGLVCP